MDKHLTLPGGVIRAYRIVIVSAAVYGCETWSVTFWEKHRLRVLKKKVLREVFGTERDEVIRD